jgi:hypothetical protein
MERFIATIDAMGPINGAGVRHVLLLSAFPSTGEQVPLDVDHLAPPSMLTSSDTLRALIRETLAPGLLSEAFLVRALLTRVLAIRTGHPAIDEDLQLRFVPLWDA